MSLNSQLKETGEDIKAGFEKLKNSDFGKWFKKSGGLLVGLTGGVIALIIVIALIGRLVAGPCAVGGTMKEKTSIEYIQTCKMNIRLNSVVKLKKYIPKYADYKELLLFVETGKFEKSTEPEVKPEEKSFMQKIRDLF